ncbi:hypothetical protein, partial [Xanthomonas albilineans]|uniref:hypothetical protein n=1 Tax=Xanthomonas albilineans TaxID=29447 RepID=UPI0005F34017
MKTPYSNSWNAVVGHAKMILKLDACAVVAGSGIDPRRRSRLTASALALASAGCSATCWASVFAPINSSGTVTTCNSGAGVLVGRNNPGATNAYPVDGSGTYANVAGCNATGAGLDAVSIFGSFGQATGAGASVFGFQSTAARWASAFGLQTQASGIEPPRDSRRLQLLRGWSHDQA